MGCLDVRCHLSTAGAPLDRVSYIPRKLRVPRFSESATRCTGSHLLLGTGRMGEESCLLTGRRRESARPCSFWSQAAWVMLSGGVLGVLMSVVYYRALGPPWSWVERSGRGTGRGMGSWWLEDGKGGGVNTGGITGRLLARSLGSVGGAYILLRFRRLFRNKSARCATLETVFDFLFSAQGALHLASSAVLGNDVFVFSSIRDFNCAQYLAVG